ncbi:dehydrodolichyl diphosphate synthase complex subunit NUS1 [Macrobrachium rosenbergii]|uniref:dehydrodolichyl diphosphate synthase complex subunit NUS1 n=1 Tax=Macrobrachium rosenbergii TaxID=79674 RepID=UPI0034D3FA3B
MDILLPLFQLLYFVAHFLVSLALSVYDTFHDLHRLLLRIYACLKPMDVSAYRLQADAALLKKIPEHVGIVVIGHNVNYISHLVTVINWCVGYGVKYISLYDAYGILKQNKSLIVKSLESISCGVRFNVITHSLDCHQVKDCVSIGSRSENGYSYPQVTVNLLSLEDGKGNLVTVARRLCDGATEVDQNMVDNCLVTQGQPDPEVVITAGKPVTILGFLPWQLRLSELYEVPYLNRFEYSEFRTVFEKYSRCEQRWGK